MNMNHEEKSRKVWIVVLLGLLTAIGPLSMDMYLPALPIVASDLDTTASLAQLSLTACLIGLAAGQLIFGPLSDILGREAAAPIYTCHICGGFCTMCLHRQHMGVRAAPLHPRVYRRSGDRHRTGSGPGHVCGQGADEGHLPCWRWSMGRHRYLLRFQAA